jgi:UDP-glucuronate 4-epimerase
LKILVTGSAGFIGYHVAARFVARGDEVVGLDNLNDYYDVALKRARLSELQGKSGYRFVEMDITDRAGIESLFARERFDRVVHLAAQAGVHYSVVNPQAYVDSNLVGFISILEACRHHSSAHLVYASSSSVYGANTQMPFSVRQNVDHPLSLYGATKKANELMAHSYSHLYGLPTTGLRFFTVYGPWGRPDTALFLFTSAILAGRPIKVFNHGHMQRDFTYIDDVVEGVVRVTDHFGFPAPARNEEPQNPVGNSVPYRIYNIGNHTPVDLLHLIALLEKNLGKKAIRNYLPMQREDLPSTYADVADLERDVGFSPHTPIEVGIERFVSWFKQHYAL